MATNSQIRIIHALKKALFMDDDTYIEYLKSFDATSSKQLTKAEAIIVIDAMKNAAIDMKRWNKRPLKYDGLDREDMATPEQLRYIEYLWKKGVEEFEELKKYTLRSYLLLRFKVDDIMFLTKDRANNVIRSIKAMHKSYKNKRVAAQM